MKVNRRQLLIGAAAVGVGLSASPVIASTTAEIVIGALYPLSGPGAQVGVDAKAAKVEILRHCHARLERFKVPVGLTFTGQALHGERFKKERSPAEVAP